MKQNLSYDVGHSRPTEGKLFQEQEKERDPYNFTVKSHIKILIWYLSVCLSIYGDLKHTC